MLAELLVQEINNIFDTKKIDLIIYFDDASCRYSAMTDSTSAIHSTVKRALETANGATHAEIYIRDNTQAYVYDYDVEADTLNRRDKTPDYFKPLEEEDKELKKIAKEQDEKEKMLNKRLFGCLIICAIPLLLSVILVLINKTPSRIYLFSFALLLNVLNGCFVLLRKIRFNRTGI